jgi:hypothetical protein
MSELYKMLVEVVDNSKDIEYLVESPNNDGKKTYKLKGPFIMCENKNRNGRVYRKDIMRKAVKEYTENFINKKRACSSIDHPNSPTLLFKDAATLTESLVEDGDNFFGVCKVLSNPNGAFLKSLMDDGILISISTRGLGNCDSNGYVNENYKLLANDVVIDPSATNAVLESITENYRYTFDGNIVTQIAIENLQEDLSKHGSRNAEEDLRKFLNRLRRTL